MTELQRHYRACNLCEAICGIVIETDDAGAIQSIRGDRDDPFSRGHICPKAVALQDVHNDPDRLRHPMCRTATGFERIGWDEAFDEVAERLQQVQRAHGPDAVAIYVGNPTVHNYGSLLYGIPLLKALGTKNRYSATSVDQLPHHFAAHQMFGHQLLIPIPDVDRTDFLLIIGANPAVSNGSLMTAPGIKDRIKAIRARGGTVVVIDPRHTRTAKLADQHLFIRPGTDAALLAALIHTLFDEDRVGLGRLADFTDGLDTVREQVREFSAERVGAMTGIEAESIRTLARRFAAASSAVCYGRIGTCVQSFGGLAQWLVNVLNTITGNLDRPGGAMFTQPAVDLVARGYGRGSHGRWRSRVRSLPEIGGELPVSALAEEITSPGNGQIKALVTSAGNPVLSTPNGGQLERALPELDFMLSIDFYRNETTRHADIILPPTAALEHDHYDLVFNLLAVRDVARYSPPLARPANDTRHDWQILGELERRLGAQDVASRMRRALTRRLGPRGILAWLLRFGPRGAGWKPVGRGLTLRQLEGAAHGIDFGPLAPVLPSRLRTRDRRIVLAPELLIGDLGRLRSAVDAAGRRSDSSANTDATQEPLLLISRRSVRSNNSWLHNSERLMRGADRCTLLVHPTDAARQGIEDGGRALVRSRTGEVEVPVELTERIMPGVVCLPHGWGHDRDGVALRVARATPGMSINDLTDDQRVDALTGNAALSGVPVEIALIDTVRSNADQA